MWQSAWNLINSNIYIPLCIYFNPFLFAEMKHTDKHLHSTMYLFQHLYCLTIHKFYLDLHSTMYLFQPERVTRVNVQPLFTFHYVSISTAKNGNHIYDGVDLHSTMYLFQRRTLRTMPRSQSNLHSTMYLFQPQIFRSLISIRIIVALLSTKQTSIIFILTCSGNIWIITDKIRIVDLPVILQYYVPTVKA